MWYSKAYEVMQKMFKLCSLFPPLVCKSCHPSLKRGVLKVFHKALECCRASAHVRWLFAHILPCIHLTIYSEWVWTCPLRSIYSYNVEICTGICSNHCLAFFSFKCPHQTSYVCHVIVIQTQVSKYISWCLTYKKI